MHATGLRRRLRAGQARRGRAPTQRRCFGGTSQAERVVISRVGDRRDEPSAAARSRDRPGITSRFDARVRSRSVETRTEDRWPRGGRRPERAFERLDAHLDRGHGRWNSRSELGDFVTDDLRLADAAPRGGPGGGVARLTRVLAAGAAPGSVRPQSFSMRIAVALNSAVPDLGSVASIVRRFVATSSWKWKVMNVRPGPQALVDAHRHLDLAAAREDPHAARRRRAP